MQCLVVDTGVGLEKNNPPKRQNIAPPKKRDRRQGKKKHSQNVLTYSFVVLTCSASQYRCPEDAKNVMRRMTWHAVTRMPQLMTRCMRDLRREEVLRGGVSDMYICVKVDVSRMAAIWMAAICMYRAYQR